MEVWILLVSPAFYPLCPFPHHLTSILLSQTSEDSSTRTLRKNSTTPSTRTLRSTLPIATGSSLWSTGTRTQTQSSPGSSVSLVLSEREVARVDDRRPLFLFGSRRLSLLVHELTSITNFSIANEPRCSGQISASPNCTTQTLTKWIKSESEFIKSLDPHHLVSVSLGHSIDSRNLYSFRARGRRTNADSFSLFDASQVGDEGFFKLFSPPVVNDYVFNVRLASRLQHPSTLC